MKKIHLLAAAVLISLISGFSSNLNILSADQNALQQKCTKCHALKLPENYTKKAWIHNVERMSKRAGLTDAEIKSIIDLNKKN
jgi:hypothetical protein